MRFHALPLLPVLLLAACSPTGDESPPTSAAPSVDAHVYRDFSSEDQDYLDGIALQQELAALESELSFEDMTAAADRHIACLADESIVAHWETSPLDIHIPWVAVDEFPPGTTDEDLDETASEFNRYREYCANAHYNLLEMAWLEFGPPPEMAEDLREYVSDCLAERGYEPTGAEVNTEDFLQLVGLVTPPFECELAGVDELYPGASTLRIRQGDGPDWTAYPDFEEYSARFD